MTFSTTSSVNFLIGMANLSIALYSDNITPSPIPTTPVSMHIYFYCPTASPQVIWQSDTITANLNVKGINYNIDIYSTNPLLSLSTPIIHNLPETFGTETSVYLVVESGISMSSIKNIDFSFILHQNPACNLNPTSPLVSSQIALHSYIISTLNTNYIYIPMQTIPEVYVNSLQLSFNFSNLQTSPDGITWTNTTVLPLYIQINIGVSGSKIISIAGSTLNTTTQTSLTMAMGNCTPISKPVVTFDIEQTSYPTTYLYVRVTISNTIINVPTFYAENCCVISYADDYEKKMPYMIMPPPETFPNGVYTDGNHNITCTRNTGFYNGYEYDNFTCTVTTLLPYASSSNYTFTGSIDRGTNLTINFFPNTAYTITGIWSTSGNTGEILWVANSYYKGSYLPPTWKTTFNLPLSPIPVPQFSSGYYTNDGPETIELLQTADGAGVVATCPLEAWRSTTGVFSSNINTPNPSTTLTLLEGVGTWDASSNNIVWAMQDWEFTPLPFFGIYNSTVTGNIECIANSDMNMVVCTCPLASWSPMNVNISISTLETVVSKTVNSTVYNLNIDTLDVFTININGVTGTWDSGKQIIWSNGFTWTYVPPIFGSGIYICTTLPHNKWGLPPGSDIITCVLIKVRK